MTDSTNLTDADKIQMLSLGCLEMAKHVQQIEGRLNELEEAFNDHILDHDEGAFNDDGTAEDDTAEDDTALVPHADAMEQEQAQIDEYQATDFMEVIVNLPDDLDYEDTVAAFMEQMYDNVARANAEGFLTDDHADLLYAAFQGEFTDDFVEVIKPPSEVENMSMVGASNSAGAANFLFSTFFQIMGTISESAQTNYMLLLAEHLEMPEELLAAFRAASIMANVRAVLQEAKNQVQG